MSQGLISEDVINQIKERVDITQVVSDYVTLSRSGQNLKGLCPFHSEKTPSFMVNASRQMFHCFGCGTGGNVFTFLMKIEGMEFPEAVRELGRRTGIEIAEVKSGASSTDQRERQRLEQLNEAAALWFQQNLKDSDLGRQAGVYLEERGIRPETVESFGLGVAPAGWDGLLKGLTRDGYKPAELAKAGLVVPKEQGNRPSQDAAGYYDRFRSRVMFPICDLRKKVIAFGGRVLDDGMPKYLNSPDTPLFNKGRSLYLLERAREAAGKTTDALVVVEGYFDAIALHQAGISHVVATLGTALTPDHIRTIRRFVTKVVLLFDPDPAGVRAALRTLDLFVDSGIGVKVVSLPDGDDPDTFIRKQGAEGFLALHDRAPSLLDFAVDHSMRQASSGLIEDRIRSVDEILRILQRTTHRIEKEECLRRVAERLGINQQRLIERYPELVQKSERKAQRPAAVPVSGDRFKGSPEERDLVLFLLHGRLAPAHLQTLDAETFSLPACRRIVDLARKHLGPDGRVVTRALLDEAVVDPQCGTVASELSLSERHFDDEEAHIQGCLERLAQKRREQAEGELISQLRAAEQEGRLEDWRKLNAQIKEMHVKKAGLRPELTQ